MIYRLRNKIIKIIVLSFLLVLAALFLIMYTITRCQINSSLDMFADIISSNGGSFPNFNDAAANSEIAPSGRDRINPEDPYTARFFFVQFDANGNPVFVNTGSISNITPDKAVLYARNALEKGKGRGWSGNFRYKAYQADLGSTVVFIDGSGTKTLKRNFLATEAAVFAGSSVIILILVILLSKQAVKPLAESYEKQRQFVTDANHELKTPLTLILTDLDLAEDDLGKNEWLDDIRAASEDMMVLVGKLVTLARMDEDGTDIQMVTFDLSETVSDTAYAFEQHIVKKGLKLNVNVPSGVPYTGDEGSIRQLISILLDNASKYCDEGGRIDVTLKPGRHPILTVDNTFQGVTGTELSRLFDRFYRADKARTAGSGCGIGLSIAKATVEKHHGQIKAQRLDSSTIRFWVRL